MAVAATVNGEFINKTLHYAFPKCKVARAGKYMWQNTAGVCLCSAASADLVEKSQAAQKLLKVVIAGLSEDAHSEEVRKVCLYLGLGPLPKPLGCPHGSAMLRKQARHAAAELMPSMHAIFSMLSI